MRDLDKKKLEVQLLKLKAAKAEKECKIIERQEDIERLKQGLETQDEAIEAVEYELKNLEG